MLSPVLFVAAAFGGYWLSRRALAPVDAITNSAQTIGAGNLNSRLEIPRTEDELQRLSLTLNRMLERIEGAFLRVTQFTADASHELRTPVALIHTEAELALRRSRSQSEYRETLHHILLEAQRTAVLIEQLLALARADSGTEALKFRPIRLNEVISDVASCWRQVAVIKKVSFREEIVRSSADLDADEAAIRRVVTILLDNAFKFSSSMVALQANEQKDKFVISVRDDGPGIPLEDQGKVFERFYRVDKARSRELGGAGLGLSIARWIVAQHKGLLTVESIPGTGSTFRVELPRLSVLTAEPVAASKNGMNGRP
jgi:heavy metal sensor kinase